MCDAAAWRGAAWRGVCRTGSLKMTSGSVMLATLSPSTSSMPESILPCWRAVITTHLKTDV